MWACDELLRFSNIEWLAVGFGAWNSVQRGHSVEGRRSGRLAAPSSPAYLPAAVVRQMAPRRWIPGSVRAASAVAAAHSAEASIPGRLVPPCGRDSPCPAWRAAASGSRAARGPCLPCPRGSRRGLSTRSDGVRGRVGLNLMAHMAGGRRAGPGARVWPASSSPGLVAAPASVSQGRS